jgi:chemotaxis protein MotB
MKVIIKKKKVKSHGGHHGGAWKVAYADFVTAMMAFFLVMWILGLSQETRKAISGYFTDPGLFSYTTGKALPFDLALGDNRYRSSSTGEDQSPKGFQLAAQRTKITAASEEIKEALEKLGKKDDAVRRAVSSVEVDVTPDGLRIELIEGEDRGFFEIGGSKPSAAAKAVLAALAPEIGALAMPIRIEGHTDRRPFHGSAYGNWELSADRANAARRLLVEAGVEASRLESVVGFADRRLRKPEDPLHVTNRRVTILVSMTARDSKPEHASGFPPVITAAEIAGAFRKQ